MGLYCDGSWCFKIDMTDIHEVENGQIVRVHHLEDRATALRQLKGCEKRRTPTRRRVQGDTRDNHESETHSHVVQVVFDDLDGVVGSGPIELLEAAAAA
ncbi:hypothetical protein [Gemmobacter denitrificans]|uniref:Uncharacterized protein n=1 Tax=Gemmobacter denitrificans TaxID=3123040 RepID=A0ABU8BZ43_9RHOB